MTWLIRYLDASLVIALLRPVLRPVRWSIVLACATAVPATLWMTYADSHPSPERVATLTVTTFALLVTAALVVTLRRCVYRRRLRRAVLHLLDRSRARSTMQ